MLLQMALFCSFLWPNSIQLYICTISSLSIHLLMDISVVSMSWLLWKVLLWTFCSLQFHCSVLSDSLWPHELQHTRPPCPSPTPGVYSNSCPLSRWCHPAISSSVVPFSSHLQSFPASGSFQMSQFVTSGGQCLSFRISPSSEYSGPISVRMDWLDYMVILFLAFWETSIVFSTMTTPAYTPTSLHSHQFTLPPTV